MTDVAPPPPSTDASADIAAAHNAATLLIDNIERVIVGKRDAIERAIVALLAGGHLLIEDAPGVGKTVLARTLAASVGAQFARIQFTPDLLPADITGTAVYRDGDFDFRPGPMFTNILLADEINRATPRAQAALLEGMQEGQVTADGTSHALPRPFFVIATQNPIELAGTYPLPEAQLDRFTMRIRIGYPSPEAEKQILVARQTGDPLDGLGSVWTLEQLCRWQDVARTVPVHDSIRDYLIKLTGATREHAALELGASPRASLALLRAAQAMAMIRESSPIVTPDHVKQLAVDVLAHRLVLSARSQLAETRPEHVVEELLRAVPVPIEPS